MEGAVVVLFASAMATNAPAFSNNRASPAEAFRAHLSRPSGTRQVTQPPPEPRTSTQHFPPS
eukprot:10396620-Prorocentrum_lima.AAC.1